MQEIKRVSCTLGITKSKLMRLALHEAAEYYKQGYFHHLLKSDFLCRIDIPDKIRFELVLDTEEREVLRKLAFTWRISQAEVMRIVVEYFVYVLNGTTIKEMKKYVRKIRYTHPVAAPMLVVYDILNNVEARWHMFHPPKAWMMLVT